MFDLDILQIVPPFHKLSSIERLDLARLTSLNPLTAHCLVIYSSRFLHLFSEEKQLHQAKTLAGLLSPQPECMICGTHAGNWEKGALPSRS